MPPDDAMTSENQRREIRLGARVPVVIHRKRATLELESTDVSYRGLFVRTSEPWPLRSLVRLELALPSGPFEAHAMVIHVAEGDVAGMGLQFWGLSGPNRKAWDDFIGGLLRELRAKTKKAKEGASPAESPELPSAVRVRVLAKDPTGTSSD